MLRLTVVLTKDIIFLLFVRGVLTPLGIYLYKVKYSRSQVAEDT